MTAAQVKLFAVSCLVASSCFAQLNVRNLTATTAVESASIPASVPLRWYRGESVNFNHWSTEGGTACAWTNLSNLVAVWSLTANRSDDQDPDNSNTYMWVTGAVTAASGKVTFSAQPSWTAMPASNYWSFVTLYQTDALGLTNEYIGVLHRANANVLYRDTGVNYAGPWEVPSNMVDSYARSLIAAGVPDYTSRSNTAAISTALTTETNRAIVAEAGLSASIAGVNVTATNAATNSLLAIAVINAEVAKGNINASFASNLIYTIISSVSPTQRVGHADTASALVMPDGSENKFWFDATNLYVLRTTNTSSVIVTGTAGEGYNGPAEGTVFTYDSVWEDGVWYSYSGSDPAWTMLVSFAGGIFNIYDDAQTPTKEWDSQPPFPATASASPMFGGIGTPTLDWVSVTTTQNIPIVAVPSSITLTNGTVFADGVYTVTGVQWKAVSFAPPGSTNTYVLRLEVKP